MDGVFAGNLQLLDGEAVLPASGSGEIKVKSFLLILVLTVSATATHAQYVNITKENNGTNSLIVPSGETWQLVTYSLNNPSRSTVPLHSSTNATENNLVGIIYSTGGVIYSMESSSASTAGTVAGSIFTGPVYLKYIELCSSYNLTFKKLSSGNTNAISATSVVIPTSATGDVDVKLEQSADNVTWTECLPGTYNSSTVKRFFRLRAVEK